MKKIGDKYQEKIDLEARDIKAEMRSFTAIDKAITNLVDCYKDEIKWSSDYMKVFEKNFYMNFENEDQFMRACRDLVEKKERKRKEEKERQRAEFERWEQQEEMKRHNREMEEQQRKQMDSLNKQHEEQRKAAGQLCASCKNYIGCPLRINLTTPVCSKYKSKY